MHKEVTEWGAVLNGVTDSRYLVNHYSSNPEDYCKWLRIFRMSPTAEMVLSKTEDSKNFFSIEKDLALLVPTDRQTEFFYSMKNGYVTPHCPAQFIYFAKQIFKIYHIGNLIAPMLPSAVALRLMARNYFGAGYTGVDAIRNFVCEKFQAITQERLIVNCGDWYEAYAPSVGLVLAMPPAMGKALSSEDMENLVWREESGLMLYSKVFGGSRGKVLEGGIYDLR